MPLFPWEEGSHRLQERAAKELSILGRASNTSWQEEIYKSKRIKHG